MPLASTTARRFTSSLLDLYRRTAGHSIERDASRLREILRRFPFWLRGHLDLAHLALANGDVATAYASAQAARSLASPDSREMAQAFHLIAQAFLARGDINGALLHLERARPHLGEEPRYKEDLAAVLMLKGDHAEVVRLLESIDADKLSAQGSAALEFARAKLGGSSSGTAR